jgi:threonine/homoserine/homoserine lactone efflux protein
MEAVSLVLGFFPFAIITAITPGPNNFMLAASGANFGYRRTLPHVLGVIVGFCLLALTVGLGLGSLMERYPVLHTVLKVVGAIFLLYLAWRIASAGVHQAEGEKARPLTFLEAALFQWVNVKAWLVVINANALYTTVGGNLAFEQGVILTGFFLASLVAANTWAVCGIGIHGVIGDNPKAMRLFNIAMGVLLVATLVPLLV